MEGTETAASMSAVIARAEQAAYGEGVEYRGRLVDTRYRFLTGSIVDLLDITEAEMRARLRFPASECRPRSGGSWSDSAGMSAAAAAGGLRACRVSRQTARLPSESPGRLRVSARRTWYRRQGEHRSLRVVRRRRAPEDADSRAEQRLMEKLRLSAGVGLGFRPLPDRPQAGGECRLSAGTRALTPAGRVAGVPWITHDLE